MSSLVLPDDDEIPILVKGLNSIEEFKSYQSDASAKNVFFFWASWHEQSQLGSQIHDIYNAFATKYSKSNSINFFTVEAETAVEISEVLEIMVVPTFVTTIGRSIVGKLEGTNPQDLSGLVKKLIEQQPTNKTINNDSVKNNNYNSITVGKTLIDAKLEKLVNYSTVMLFMKGSPTSPKCGFSRQVVEILKTNNILFSSFDILTDEDVRSNLKIYSDWPTYPQLYVKGTLIGGLDIIKEMESAGDFNGQLGL